MQFRFNPVRSVFRFFRFIGTLVILILLFFLVSNKKIPNADIIFGVLLASQIPAIIIFIQYFINDYKSEFFFEKPNNSLRYIKGKKSYTYTIEQIKKIQIVATASRLKKEGIPLFIKDDFFYYKIYFDDEKSIIVTSLLLNGKLINAVNFNNINFEKHTKFFPFFVD